MVATVLLFPGQGAQRVGMGKDLADQYPAAREVFQAIDEALGVALTKVMWEGPEPELTLTHNAQPAILAHSLAVHAVIRSAITPAVAAGHSLGEYSAYAAAGSLTPPAAARLVRLRGELMLAAGEARPGTMAAILGLATDEVAIRCREASSNTEVVVAANENAPDQTVISGDPAAVERAGALCREAGAKRVLPLKVSGAFHSPLMAAAREGLEAELDRIPLGDPTFPVVANASAQPVTNGAAARRFLGEQLTATVRWADSVRRCFDVAGAEARYLELGPGRVLAGLARRVVPEADGTSAGTVADVNAFLDGAS